MRLLRLAGLASLDALSPLVSVPTMQHASAGMLGSRAGAAAARASPRSPTAAAPAAAAPAASRRPQQRSVATAASAATTSASTDAAPCPVSAAAFSTALDASSGLPVTWLTHWREVEERRAARRALIDSTRGRQQQRLRQVASLLGSVGEAEALGFGSPAPSSSRPGLEEQLFAPSGRLEGAGSGGNLDLPPFQEMSELDELTWLASHPPEGEAGEPVLQGQQGQQVNGSSSGSSSGAPPWGAQLQQQGDHRQQQQHGPNGHQPHSQHDLNQHHRQGHIVGLAGSAAGPASPAVALQGPVELRVGSELLSVRPLWIAVYQPEEGGPAKLFEAVFPLLPDVVGRLSADISPFCSVADGMHFGGPGRPADEAADGWKNYFVGLVGGVSAHEDDILWPNQVLHRDRVLFNVRNGWDVARFLSEPKREDVEAHRDNLLRLAAERGYRRGWCWHMLRLRWGAGTLRALGLDV